MLRAYISCRLDTGVLWEADAVVSIGTESADVACSWINRPVNAGLIHPLVPLSGKDFHKHDRSAAVIAHQVALTGAQLGMATEATVPLVTFPGDEVPRVLRIATPQGTCGKASVGWTLWLVASNRCQAVLSFWTRFSWPAGAWRIGCICWRLVDPDH